jgi:hypothetical protein
LALAGPGTGAKAAGASTRQRRQEMPRRPPSFHGTSWAARANFFAIKSLSRHFLENGDKGKVSRRTDAPAANTYAAAKHMRAAVPMCARRQARATMRRRSPRLKLFSSSTHPCRLCGCLHAWVIRTAGCRTSVPNPTRRSSLLRPHPMLSGARARAPCVPGASTTSMKTLGCSFSMPYLHLLLYILPRAGCAGS